MRLNEINEIMLLHILKTYCLPKLLYGCEIWPLDTMSFHDVNVIWNKCKKLQFIHTVNGDGSKTANIIKRQC